MEDDLFGVSPDVYVTESELDALTLQAHGFTAVSVSSATTCIGSDGKLKIQADHLSKLEGAERIFIVTDMDEAGNKCAAAFEGQLPPYKVFRLNWEYRGKDSHDPKDIGEVYAQNPAQFKERITALTEDSLNRPPAWRQLFKSLDEMQDGGIQFVIKDFLPEGVNLIGGLPASGKTWFALSIARAITTGDKFLGLYDVPEPTVVLYLTPEVGERALKRRAIKMGVNPDRFLCRTLHQGVLSLDDPLLLGAVKNLKPVVILDTAIRFSDAGDENSATDNAQGLAKLIFGLLAAGAKAVVGVHHSPKDSADKKPDLRNTLRGTGDFGAMADCVYGLKLKDEATMTIEVSCVKPRDFDPVKPFMIRGKPYLDQKGDFVVLDMTADEAQGPGYDKSEAKCRKQADELDKLAKIIEVDPKISDRELERQTGIGRRRVPKVAAMGGFVRDGNNCWVQEPQRDLALVA